MRIKTPIVVLVFLLCMTAPQLTHDTGITIEMTPIDPSSILSAESGVPTQFGPYIAIELVGGSVVNKGSGLVTVLDDAGIVSELHTMSEVLTQPSLLDNAQTLILDGSCGSGDGSTISSQFITLLVRLDLPTILVGRAAWLIHRLRQTNPPGVTALLDTQLQTTPPFSGAVFLSQPQSLSIGSQLTTESLSLPVDSTQAERSRLIDLTGSAVLSPLRYESWPLDVFLFGPEDPALLTGNGKGLLVNTVAYVTSLREYRLPLLFQFIQNSEGQALAGGLHHSHTPSMSGTYHAVHTMHDLLDPESFATWRSDNQALVLTVLTELYVDFGSEAGFSSSMFDSTPSIDTTAMGLWLTTVMNLGSQFSVTKLTTYLSSKQSIEGGFSDDMTVTYHVTEAMSLSGGLGAINTVTLESWLRSCVVDGGTGTPENWGGVAENPTDGVARNIYATHFVKALWILGNVHVDPAKLTEWIQDTSNGDGSYSDSISPDMYVTRGTASALTTMSALGTLESSNKTSGISWFSANQLPSGGFGMGAFSDDIVGKTWGGAEVATCLRELGETSGAIASGILDYVDDIKNEAGFDLMEEIPSLMWSYWLSEVNRVAHTGTVDNFLIDDYLNGFDGFGFSIYPGHSNLTVMSAPEYDMQQYYLTGTWAQFFGAGLAGSAGTTLSPSLVSGITLYLSLRQHSSGHYRPYVVGTPHMQYSVAAVEALFQLDELDTIWYRTELDSAVLSQYSSGVWSSAGWDLEPFSGVQSAIDFLSTRTALRLGVITPLMATEIVSTIESRVQYNDLWALSWDVKTLVLLNSTSFSSDLESVDKSSVISALGSTFTDGWFNSTTLWQPVFTASVLDMVSVLGLRPQMMDVEGFTLSASVPVSVQLGSSLDIPVTITSSQPTHSVYVQAFDSWTLFENVTNTDTLSLQIPSGSGAIGVQEISLVVWDKGMSRAFDSGSTEVLGSLEGMLTIPIPNVVRRDSILGTVTWTLLGGGDAGPTGVTIRLSNGSYFQDWSSTEQSPFDFAVPTDGLGAGPYNLIVTLSRVGCDDLVLWQVVTVVLPEFTYISTNSPIQGMVGDETLIPWSLLLDSDDSFISDETVTFTIWDEGMGVVHTDSMLSLDGLAMFNWTPTARGPFTFRLFFERNGVLMESEFNGSIEVFDLLSVNLDLNDNLVAPSSAGLTISVLDSGSQGIFGVSVHSLVTLNGTVILDSVNITSSDGTITFILSLDSPGGLVVTASVPMQEWLLEVTNQTTHTVLGDTTLVLSLPGLPIEQGLNLPLSAMLLDWAGSPLEGAQVDFTVSWTNGTIIDSMTVFTGADGTCATSHLFVFVGDFWIEATYVGAGLNSSASDSAIQRVRVTPNMILLHDPSANVGDITEFLVAIHDSLGQYITGRTLDLSIIIDSVTVFQTQVTSVNGFASIMWDPTGRGLAFITLSHAGDIFFLFNSTTVSMSVLEVVSATLESSLSEVDLFGSVILTYTLTSGEVAGVDIVFQVLGMDLVPAWTQHVLTDGSGVATAIYTADDEHGLLRVTVIPDDDQFMLGGNTQKDLTVMTYVHVTSDMLPEPPSVQQLTNATVSVTDDLGIPIDGLRIYIRVRETYNVSLFTVSLYTVDGLAVVQFTPDQWGLYSIEIWSNGGPSVHGFAEPTRDHEHTVHCPTGLTVITMTDIEVGDTISITARLLDVFGDPMVGFDVNLTFTGDTTIGPLTFVTNTTGHVSWEFDVDEQGYWAVDAQFFGLGVFLPSSQTAVVHSSFGTTVVLELQNQGDIVAGLIPLNVTALLRDSGGTPLEGRTIHWETYHETLGMMDSGSVVQLGVEPEVIEILLAHGGNFTVIFSYAGSDHYHSSNAALNIIVKGTSTIDLSGSLEIDRASNENISISVFDELGVLLSIGDLPFDVSLTNTSGTVAISSWLSGNNVDFSVLGLEVGDYTLNITIGDSSTRVGSVLIMALKIVTQSELATVSSDLSGIMGQTHVIIVRLADSLNDNMEDMTVWISLYRPDGTEVYGSLGEMTPLDIVLGVVDISWTPTWTGNYTLAVRYYGDDWRLPVEFWIDILTRRLTILVIEGPEIVEFLDNIELTATLTSTLASLGGFEVSFTVMSGGEVVLEEIATTTSRGVASVVLQGLLAGQYTVTVHYTGTDSLAPCTTEFEVAVQPRVVSQLTPTPEPYVGTNCSIDITVAVIGVGGQWSGNVTLSIFDPLDVLLLNRTLNIGQQFELVLFIVPSLEGKFTVNVTVSGLPVAGFMKSELQFTITPVPISIVLDVGTTPVAAGAPIIALIGYILRRRFGGSLEGLPTEWGGT